MANITLYAHCTSNEDPRLEVMMKMMTRTRPNKMIDVTQIDSLVSPPDLDKLPLNTIKSSFLLARDRNAMSSETVPFFDTLSSIYDPTILEEQTTRYKNLYQKFVDLYHAPPSHIVRAPGRVNLIVHSSKRIKLTEGRAYRLLQLPGASNGYCTRYSYGDFH